tara:strand:+ start:3642 stop:5003 length:1362 start_codon:yes stop_codon:yes gene_type:complete
MSLGRVRLAWTTNFDQLIEKACSHAAIADKLPRALAVASLEQPDKASDLIADEAWPVLIKLHGDFFYRKLKNVKQELQEQDATLRYHLAEECGRRGLAVIGFSGRDESVMRTLREALDAKTPFPHGLFWFVRPGETPAPAVIELIGETKRKGSQAGIIEVGTFDELMADLFLPHQESLSDIRDLVKDSRPKRDRIPITYSSTATWPVLRSNALHITAYPATCTVFDAAIGKTSEVRALAAPHARDLAVSRRKAGVVAFGTRSKLSEVFAPHNPSAFDRYPIEQRRLRYDCPELGLLYHALAQGIANRTGLYRSQNAKGRYLFAPETKVFTQQELGIFSKLKSKGVWRLRPDAVLHEGFRLALDFRDRRFWMLVEPTIVVTADGCAPYRGTDRSDIAREPLVTRYNRQRNEVLQLWIRFLQRHFGSPMCIAFPSETNREAEFSISTVTAYSRKA